MKPTNGTAPPIPVWMARHLAYHGLSPTTPWDYQVPSSMSADDLESWRELSRHELRYRRPSRPTPGPDANIVWPTVILASAGARLVADALNDLGDRRPLNGGGVRVLRTALGGVPVVIVVAQSPRLRLRVAKFLVREPGEKALESLGDGPGVVRFNLGPRSGKITVSES